MTFVIIYSHSKLMTLLNFILRKIVKIILFFNITLWWPFVADGGPLSPCSTVRSTAVNWSFWGYRFRFLKFETSSESTRHGGMYDQGARSFGSISRANGFHSVRNISNSFKMCPTRAFFNPQMLFSIKKLQKSSILTLKADEVSISTPLLTCQTLKKSILRKISLDHSKNWNKLTNLIPQVLHFMTFLMHEISKLLQMHQIDLICSIWYGLYQTSFCQAISWVGFVSILTLPRYELDKQLQVQMLNNYCKSSRSSRTSSEPTGPYP